MRTLLIALLAFAATPALASSISLTDVGNMFCAGRISGDMTEVEKILSPDLTAAIAEAEAKNDAIQKQHPDEKPPLGDGIPWQSFPDHASQCMVVGASGTAENPEAVLFYQIPGQVGFSSWSDRLVLAFIDNELRIDDVIYSDGRRLRDVLVKAFEE